MDITEARKEVKSFLKKAGLYGVVKYTSDMSISFDFVFSFYGDEKYRQTLTEGLNHLSYTDKSTDLRLNGRLL